MHEDPNLVSALTSKRPDKTELWFIAAPLFATAVLALTLIVTLGLPIIVLAVAALLVAVSTAVHHAEVIAHRIGEPYGTLGLALAVTVIEAALVLSIMLAGGVDAYSVPRDTIYAAVMIIANGVVGVCLMLGGLHHGEQSFRIEGTGSGLAALVALSGLVLVLPALTISAPNDMYTESQLIFVASASLSLWVVFVFIQNRHRDYFLPAGAPDDENIHAAPPTVRQTWASAVLLIVSLVAVVGLAKVLSVPLEQGITALGAPKATVGILIAVIVLLPETIAALRAAIANRLQTSMNLAIGSALASIGLTVPVVVLAAVLLDLPVRFGLSPKDMALLALTFVVSAITLGSGRTNMMQGAVHLVLFAAFLFLPLVP
jgi:Ca2+:H+ antiporter